MTLLHHSMSHQEMLNQETREEDPQLESMDVYEEELQARHPAIRDFPQVVQAFENLLSQSPPSRDQADIGYAPTKFVEPKLKQLMKESRKQLSSEDSDKKRQL